MSFAMYEGSIVGDTGDEDHRSFDPSYYQSLFEAEDRHFWFVSRARTIAALASQVVSDLSTGFRVLEVGCGTGNVLKSLVAVCRAGSVVGMDLFGDGLRLARQRVVCPLVQGDVQLPPFSDTFDVIGLFDVLEHIPDDIAVLRSVRNLLSPRGTLLITVPAHQSLWSYFDVASHHCRRYTREELGSKLAQSGFRVEYMSEYMATLFPVIWLGRKMKAVLRRNDACMQGMERDLALDELRIVPLVNAVLTAILGLEARLVARRHRLPFGSSIVALARKDT